MAIDPSIRRFVNRRFLRQSCVLLALTAVAWSIVAGVTGGVRFQAGGVRISARGMQNPLLAAVLAALLGLTLAPAGARWRTVAAELAACAAVIPAWTRSRSFLTLAAAAMSATVLVIGLTEGAFVAGGPDPYGYVSQARLWATDMQPVDAPLMAVLPDTVAREASAPLGWRPARQGNAIVPIYSVGYPMLMGMFQRAGGPDAVFYVLPLMGALTVWATFIVGRAMAGPGVGAAAAILMASSPAFLVQITGAPMSDVPATAWWTLCLALLTLNHAGAALAAGLAAGAAIMTRPNLVPLTIGPALLLAWPLLRHRRLDAATLRHMTAFAAGVIPPCLAVAAINARWYGSPLTSGYGALGYLYSARNVWPNLRQYATWLVETQTPLIAAALAGPFLMTRLEGAARSRGGAAALRAATIGLTAALIGCYLFYMPFEPWWNLRFVLPAYPALMVFFAVTVVVVARRLCGGLAAPVAATLVLLLGAHGFAEARSRGVFDSTGELRYEVVGRYVAQHLPERAVVLAVLHSGSAGFYSGRPTIRWDWLASSQLDDVIARLEARGYAPYLVIESSEVAPLESLFAGSSSIAALDWPPVAATPDGDVRIFNVGSGRAGTGSAPIVTGIIPRQ
jgi:hypothetical protein